MSKVLLLPSPLRFAQSRAGNKRIVFDEFHRVIAYTKKKYPHLYQVKKP